MSPLNTQYTFARAVNEIMIRMGRRSDNSFEDRVGDYLDSAQLRIAQTYLEVPDLEDLVTIHFAADTQEYDLRTTSPPITDFIGIKYVKNLETEYRMRRFSFEEYRQLVNQATADPMRWTRKGYTFAMDPIPAEAGDIQLEFRRQPALGVLELGNQWQDSLMKLATSIAWSALMEHERAKSIFMELPAALQLALQQPLDQYQWESAFDPDLGIRPMSWGY